LKPELELTTAILYDPTIIGLLDGGWDIQFSPCISQTVLARHPRIVHVLRLSVRVRQRELDLRKVKMNIEICKHAFLSIEIVTTVTPLCQR
jgi:hypothetical protein